MTAIYSLTSKRSSEKPAIENTSFETIDHYIEQQRRRLKMPGVSMAIVEGDQVVHQRGFGRARPGGEAPTSQTPFLLGSATKSFTALAVMQLVEVGKVELDAPVQRYLPWFRVADPEASAQMTVRHLLNQTSGMSMLAGSIHLADMDDSPDATERQARALSTLRLSRPVGASFQYCNLNYNLLGLVIEAASGQSYAEYLQEHIFAPLDMTRSRYLLAPPLPDNLATGYFYEDGRQVPQLVDYDDDYPGGSIVSTAEDMAHFMLAHLGNGCYQGSCILEAATLAEMHQRRAETPYEGQNVTYGFVEGIQGDQRLLGHSGAIRGFGNILDLVPAHNLGYFFSFNEECYQTFACDIIPTFRQAFLKQFLSE